MQIFKLKLWSALFLLLALLLTSCRTTKYQELGFGGGNSSWVPKKTESINIKSDTFVPAIQFYSCFTNEITNSEFQNNNLLNEQFSPNKLNKKHQLKWPLFNPKMEKVNRSKTMLNLLKKTNPYITMDKKSSVKKWLLFILSMFTLVLGSTLLLISFIIMGYGYDVQGGVITILASILLIALGILLIKLTKKTP